MLKLIKLKFSIQVGSIICDYTLLLSRDHFIPCITIPCVCIHMNSIQTVKTLHLKILNQKIKKRNKRQIRLKVVKISEKRKYKRIYTES